MRTIGFGDGFSILSGGVGLSRTTTSLANDNLCSSEGA